MRGTRPLDNVEISEVYDAFDGIFAIRNRSLFMLGVSTGGRISELLGLRLGDVFQNGTRGQRSAIQKIGHQGCSEPCRAGEFGWQAGD